MYIFHYLAKNTKTTNKEDKVLDDNRFGLGIDDINSKNIIDLDYDFNSEYGDGDIPEIDKPKSSNATNVVPDEVPNRNKPSTNKPGTK